MTGNFSPNQTVAKPVVRSTGGVVAAQHVVAAAVGAQVLAEGGNAVDAAVATSFALGALEPWMSGIGGGGLMVVRHPEGGVDTVDFGMRAPQGLRTEDYPLVEGEANDLFAWPAVLENRNMIGPLAIAVPGVVDGIGAAHAAWGRRPWAGLIAPAVALARQGLSVDWYATMMIGQAAHGLRHFPASRDWFLPDGAPPPVSPAPRNVRRLPSPRLAETLEILQHEGPRALYEGPLALRIAADAATVGARLSADDLAAYRAEIKAPLSFDHGGARVWATPELSAGPTLAHTLREHAGVGGQAGPDAAWYLSMARALRSAYDRRLALMGDVEGARDVGCTTHFSIADADGMVVALTQTLLSVFGSQVTLPDTGILMNNGAFWFDPRPDRPNSLAPGKRCLSNMCPVILQRADDAVFGLGASGGRRILPAVAHLTSLLTDVGMELEEALHCPRIDQSGSDILIADARLAPPIIEALGKMHDVQTMKPTVFPSWFANISAVQTSDHTRTGGCEPGLPWADAVANS